MTGSSVGVGTTHNSSFLRASQDLGFVPPSILLFPPSAVLMDSPQHAHGSPGLFVWCGDTLSDPVPTRCSSDLCLIPTSMFQPRCATYHSFSKPTAFSLSCLFALLRQFFLHKIPPSTLCLMPSFPQEAPWVGLLWFKLEGRSQRWELTTLCLSAPYLSSPVFAPW